MKDVFLLKLFGKVNDLWNDMTYEREPSGRDQWQTPLEFITKGHGDCEDFAIAKYMTLRDLVDPDKLMLTYGLRRGQPHMLVTYDVGPYIIVLDETVGYLQEREFRPIYSFTDRDYFVDLPEGRKLIGRSYTRLSKWHDLIERFNQQKRDN